MGTLLDLASLVVVPSGYKEDIIYSVKPTDGSGDLDFTRALDTATRVGSDGLIEKVRTNVVTHSQTLDNAAWSKTAMALTTSATANPLNGALTAQDAIPTAVSSIHRVFQLAGVLNTANTWSIFAKAKGYNFITIVENGNTSASVSFNLSTGAVSTQISAVGQIQSLGGGWFRCSMIHTTASTPRFDVFVSPTDSQSAYTADGTSGVTLFGAQAEASDFGATPYIPTTTAAVSVGMLANVPRLDYLGGGCPKLLLEPQRTNVALQSETFVFNTGTTVTLNNTASPDGFVSADKIVEDTSTGTHIISFTGILGGSVDSSPYCISVFVKAAGRTRIRVFDNNQNSIGDSEFNISTGVVISGTGKIEDYGNGWYRCTIFPLKDFLTTSDCRIQLLNATGSNTYTGDGTSGVFLWGKQTEAGSYATSYIPTLQAAVTRSADAASKTGISALIGQTEGTLFAEFDWQQQSGSYFINSLSDGTTNNDIFMSFGSTEDNAIRFQIVSAGVTSVNFSSAVLPSGRYKVALAYANNDAVSYINGVQQFTDSSVVVPATSQFRFARSNDTLAFEGTIIQQLLFPTRLTNTQLQELTTL